MKDKEKICPKCGNKMKYRGGRRFICKKCGFAPEYERDFEVREGSRFGL